MGMCSEGVGRRCCASWKPHVCNENNSFLTLLSSCVLVSLQARMSHWLSESEADSLDGSYCYWNHDGEPLLPSAAERGSNGGNGRLISRS